MCLVQLLTEAKSSESHRSSSPEAHLQDELLHVVDSLDDVLQQALNIDPILLILPDLPKSRKSAGSRR